MLWVGLRRLNMRQSEHRPPIWSQRPRQPRGWLRQENIVVLCDVEALVAGCKSLKGGRVESGNVQLWLWCTSYTRWKAQVFCGR